MSDSTPVALPETPGLVWEPLQPENRDDLIRLIAEMERIDNPPYRTSAEEVDQIFAVTYAGLGGWDQDSQLVAYAIVRLVETNGYQAICSGGVGVNWRKRGVGTEIFQWEVATARKMLADKPRPAQIVCFVDRSSSNISGWMYTFGFEKKHSFLELRRDLNEPIPEIEPGQYLKIVPWSETFDDRVRRAHNELMELTSGSPAQDMESWTSNRPFFAPEWSFIALDKSSDVAEVAGYLLSARYEQDWEALGWKEGYTEILGVLPDYAESKVAQALLSRTLNTYRDSGMAFAAVGLAEENPTEVAKLYTSFGYQATGGSTMWVVDLKDKPTLEDIAEANQSAAGVKPARL
ncbi:MAG: N-acetyltransferase [Mobiluncus sp.]|uniref:N-acetyltransferase n=2 Tax=Mobiluncus TaxID=2050 RepID=UPI00258F65FB|nr:N-acetyltransferase [Mobiluncus sp.]MCI6585333.1 N-acetyltransferase [Mobiluncus sp.]